MPKELFSLPAIITLAAFALCLGCALWNVLRLLKNQSPILSLAGFFVFFLVFLGSSIPATGGRLPIISDLLEGHEGPPPYVLDISQIASDSGGPIDTGNLKLTDGELLSVTPTGKGSVDVKARIKTTKNAEKSVRQCYNAVVDLIVNHGFDQCDNISFWAISNLAAGGDTKVISFTMDKPLIQGVAEGEVTAETLEGNLSDLWLYASLRS